MAGSSKVNGWAGIGERNFSCPEKSQAGGGKISPIKDGDPDLNFISQK